MSTLGHLSSCNDYTTSLDFFCQGESSLGGVPTPPWQDVSQYKALLGTLGQPGKNSLWHRSAKESLSNTPVNRLDVCDPVGSQRSVIILIFRDFHGTAPWERSSEAAGNSDALSHL